YRRPVMLKRALNSIINQTYDNFIVYVIDNASGDETASIVDPFAQNDSRIKYYCHLNNIGAINNCIYGFGMVKTPYFCYLADDDFWLPDFLKEAVNSMNKYPDAGFFGAASICITENGIPYLFSGMGNLNGYFLPPEGACLVWEKGWPQQSAVLYRNEVLRTVGNISHILGFDLDYLTRIASRFPIVLSFHPLAFFTINQRSLSSSRSVKLIKKEWDYIRNKIEKNEYLSYTFKKRILQFWGRRLPYQVRMMTMLSLIKGDISDAKYGVELLKHQPVFVWTTPIIKIAVDLADINNFTRRLVGVFFKYRMKVFTAIRKIIFFVKYRYNKPVYWWCRKLTK
ncbi:MAG: glycosyltransferase family 2 protein, partial [Elusimicrobiota bacterium]|nr:glycosyltransferase family 2 protein [Elusimicrobiota bacterium]